MIFYKGYLEQKWRYGRSLFYKVVLAIIDSLLSLQGCGLAKRSDVETLACLVEMGES